MTKNHQAASQDDSVIIFPGKPNSGGQHHHFTAESWFDDACIMDMDYFVKTLAGIKSKGVRPDLIGSIITHYASKWLPDLSSAADAEEESSSPPPTPAASSLSESATVSWMKKRFFVEALVGVLPPERDSVPCSFLLRLLRTANMVAAEPAFRAELERRAAWQLDQASLKELMIPSFSHTCGTLLDVDLVLRLVKRFLTADDVAKSGLAVVKVAKLVDSYLAEAALDASLTMTEFVSLAGALPSHARAFDDGLYRAIDTFLKTHPNASKQERKSLCKLIDSRKLSPEASLHAAQNDRLPVRAVIQVLFSENSKRWSAAASSSFSGPRSPICPDHPNNQRCLSRREPTAETRRLREDVSRLQGQFNAMQAQMERVLLMLDHQKKKPHGGGGGRSSSFGFFRWKKFSFKSTSTTAGSAINGNNNNNNDHDVSGFERQTPTSVHMKTKVVRGKTPPKFRRTFS